VRQKKRAAARKFNPRFRSRRLWRREEEQTNARLFFACESVCESVCACVCSAAAN
jgi:muconolactone delta-isomerase